MEAWRWFSYFPSQVTAKLDKRQLYNWVWPELRHRHSQSGGCLAEFLSLTWSLDLLQEEFVASVTNVYGTNVTRRALSAQKIKVCDINYVPSPQTRFCFHLCWGELTFTWRQVFTRHLLPFAREWMKIPLINIESDMQVMFNKVVHYLLGEGNFQNLLRQYLLSFSAKIFNKYFC